jgi:phage terminase small subunit
MARMKRPPGVKSPSSVYKPRHPRDDPFARKRDSEGLLPQEVLFVNEYLRDAAVFAAYQRAGYAGCKPAAFRVFNREHVQAAIQRRLAVRAEEADFDSRRWFQVVSDIATADARDFIEMRRVACKECFPGQVVRPLYQAPDPACLSCGGEGFATPFGKDTRHLSRRATNAFAGLKVTKDGFEYKLHPKMPALEMLGRAIGVFAEDNKQKSAGLEALAEYLKGGGADPLPVNP